ncbi:Oxygen-independent coproporphyrinogen-III oxidase-like protein [Rubripirellula amarantea]|uniref:Heme chaperone HemW n=1 Tax=Rubripirellula amarantea TaxID=2527999 RepID=A0A5C5WFB5_9BACT|nr:radical SAM family heme chaperone HemW [Rubripirellula amarantea]TWT49340.1 Oxygen-independent coproporphyrinogen-III oxidase-like protein [Rubripirellula amarantea]
MTNDQEPPGGWPVPRSAYIHVPFCRHRCGYCNFSVVAGRDDLIARFIAAIDRELSLLNRPQIDTLFIGGGTPTHLDAPELDRFLGLLAERFELSEKIEWSVEANPEDIDANKLDVLVRHGVNRMSLGVQSFNADKLAVLERGHSGVSATEAIKMVASRIKNVSLDLIFAAPEETLEVWQDDLETALELPIEHLSTYALTFEKGTSFWKRREAGQLHSHKEDLEIEMYQLSRQMTAGAGLAHYEISSFARVGSRCRHNMAYWDGRGWFAAGPGAARFVGGRREVNHRSTTTYLKKMEADHTVVAEVDELSPTQYARERLAFGARMIDGIDIDEVSQSCGVDLHTLCKEEFQRIEESGWATIANSHLKLTDEGILFADAVARELLG